MAVPTRPQTAAILAALCGKDVYVWETLFELTNVAPNYWSNPFPKRSSMVICLDCIAAWQT